MFKVPWAKRNHYHPDYLWKYIPCSRCKHLLLFGHVENKIVRVLDRREGSERTEIYGPTCAPDYDIREIGIDGQTRFYKDNKEVKDVRTSPSSV